MDLREAFPGIEMNYNAIRTSDIEQQNMFDGEVIEVKNMPLWKKVSLFITFVCGLTYGSVYIADAIVNNKPTVIEGIKIYLTIILTFMGLSFGGYKFHMRNNVKESLQIIERNAIKRDANAQIRHNQVMNVFRLQGIHNTAQTAHNTAQTAHNTAQTAHNVDVLVLLNSMNSSLASINSSLASIDKSLRRQ